MKVQGRSVHNVVIACCVFAVNSAVVVIEASDSSGDERTAISLEALTRLKGMDLETNPAIKTAVMKILEQIRGTSQFVEIVRDFNIKDQEAALLEIAAENSGNET